MTEKFYEALIAGSVPVVLGAPNVGDFAPADRCYVDAADFAGPADLARFLVALAGDEARYAGYLAWKREGLRPAFRELLASAAGDPFERLARRLEA